MIDRYYSAFAITPSDSTRFSQTAAVYVGALSTFTVVFLSGATATFTAVPAGTTIPIVCVGIKATGFTGSGLVGLQ